MPLAGCDNKSAIPSHPQSRGFNEQTGRLTMSQLTHAEMRDRLSWWTCAVTSPVWRRSLRCTQRLPVMGLAASESWISHHISRGNMCESGTLRGRETVLGFDARKVGHANAARLKSIASRTGYQGWRAVYAERCTYGSGRGTRHTLWVNGLYFTQGCEGGWRVGKREPNETPKPCRQSHRA